MGMNDSVNKNTAMGLIQRLVSNDILALDAYHVPASEGLIKLDAMENPFQLDDQLKQQWADLLLRVEVNRYPDPSCNELKESIRKCFDISRSVGLLLGNGSDELIQLLAILVGGKDRVFMSPVPSFSMYQQICIATATRFVGVPLQSDFTLDAEQLIADIEKYQPACLFLAYPNNPTGNCFDRDIVLTAIDSAPGLVVIDEAYFAFCQKSFIDSIAENPNLIVLRTMSKSGLAGLRLGMMMADPQWIEQLEKLRLPYNINSLTQASADFYLQYHQVLADQCAEIVSNRAWLMAQLQAMPGLQIYSSEANFILVRVLTEQGAAGLFDALRDQGILVKNLHHPNSSETSPLFNCLRITVSSKQENTACIEALKQGLDQKAI